MPNPPVYPKLALICHWRLTMVTLCLTLSLCGCSRPQRQRVEPECEPNPRESKTRKLVADGRRLLKGDVAGAEEHFEQAVALDPEFVDAYVGLGEARAKRENWDKLAQAMSKATALAPTWAPYWERLGFAERMRSLKDAGHLAGAKKAYERCVAEDTNLAACWNGLGLVQAQLTEANAAMQSLSTAVQRDPSKGDYYVDLAELYDRLGYYRQTKAVAAEALTRAKPEERPVWKRRLHRAAGHAALTLGDPADAIVQLEAAKALSSASGEPSEADVLLLLGLAYAKANKNDLALDHLKGFRARACSGARASQFRAQCTVCDAEIERLEGRSGW